MKSSPKRVKWRKRQKGRMNGLAYAGSDVSFGDWGLATTESGWISSRQIEAARVALTRHVKRGGRIWIRIFPDKPVTKKPAETRMGTGKGAPRVLGCRREAGPHPLRNRRGSRRHRA